MTECASHVGKGFVTYPCHLEKGHDGPCVALENTPSIRQRRAWEEAQGDLKVFEAPPEVIHEVIPEPVDTAMATITSGARMDNVHAPPVNALAEAREWLLAAAQGVDRILAQRIDLDCHLASIESALSGGGDVTEARAALSILRALLRS